MSALREWITRQTSGRDRDLQDMGLRLENNWDLLVGRLEVLAPNDPTAEETVRAASDLLQVITTNYGPIAGWTLAQHHLLHRTANRVWGPEQRVVTRPNWTER